MKNKVLILQSILSSYNVPTYNIIAQKVDLTVAFTHKNENKEKVSFNSIKLNYINIGGIIIIRNDFYKMCSQFDVVIFMADLHFISYCFLPFLNRRYKVIPWTIGIRASYKRRYDVNRKKNIIDRIYGTILKKSDAIIFYMKEPLKFWENFLNKEKVFIAHNTVEVLLSNIHTNNPKNRILFIGTLYKEKKIYELLDAYIEAKSNCKSETFFYLDIIGKGEEYDNIKAIIQEHQLSHYVILHGAIYDESVLERLFSQSILCISPDQAGLSVLKSMGYGVPFVTKANSITGGERMNILNNENGLLYETQSELISIIVDSYRNPEFYIKMGEKAKKYYYSNATTNHMAQGFLDAINYVINSPKNI